MGSGGGPTAALVPILGPQRGVCQVCRGWSGSYRTCWQCRSFGERLGLTHQFVALPIALAVTGERLALALRQYKDGHPSTADQDQEVLLSLVDGFLPRHESCLRRAAGVTSFDAITWIPSSRKRQGTHPLRALLARSTWAGHRVEDVLQPSAAQLPEHEAAPERYTVPGDVQRMTVLLVDDTWTAGANAFSAAHALYRAGAATVAVAVIGRHFTPDFQNCRIYLDEARRHPFQPDHCAVCTPVPAAAPSLDRRAAQSATPGATR